MTPEFRRNVVDSLRRYDQQYDIPRLAAQHGTPLLLLDPNAIIVQYERLQQALPFLRIHYALKAFAHPLAIQAVKAAGGYFDVATNGEIDLVLAGDVDMSRCMHTHPIKKPSEIDYAYGAGIGTYVVENMAEMQKFVGRPSDIRIMVRLAYRNPLAKSDLSLKFGAQPEEAIELIRFGKENGINVVGFCLHVGSQSPDPGAYKHAIEETIKLCDRVEDELGVAIDTIDIGGGMPVGHRAEMPSIEEIGSVIRPILEPLTHRFTFLAEPGRYIAATSMILVSQVVGKSERFGEAWYYLDDGLYGSYSNILTEDVHPAIIAMKELRDGPTALEPSTIAGPTCDSADVIAQGYELPRLELGDLLISPMMGAYTTVTASMFNSIPLTPIIAVSEIARPLPGVSEA